MANTFGLAQVKREGAFVGLQELLEDGYSAQAARELSARGLTKKQIEAVFEKMGFPNGGPKPSPPPFDPNEVPALAAKLSDLVMMWEAKFGDKWVKRQTLDAAEDPFWQIACGRFENNDLLESTVGGDDGSEWVRLKEYE